MNIYLKIASVLLLGAFGGKVARKFNLPSVTGYLIGGIFLGPSVLNVVTSQDSSIISFVNEFTLSAIAFNIGGEFLISTIKKLGKEIFIITVFEVLGAVSIVFGMMYFIFNQDFVFSIMVASMAAATAPAGTMIVIRQYRARGKMSDTILPVAALDDALGIMVFGLALSLAKATLGLVDGSIVFQVMSPFIEIFASLFVGGILGLILSKITQKVSTSEEQLFILLVFILMCAGLAPLLSLSSLLTAMMMGAVYINVSSQAVRAFTTINNFMTPFNVLFFAFAGTSINFGILGQIGLLGLGYLTARLVGKVFGTTLGAIVAKSDPVVKKYLGWALLPQGGISIGLSLVVSQQLPQFSEAIVTLILFSVLVFEIAGPILAKVAITRAGEIPNS